MAATATAAVAIGAQLLGAWALISVAAAADAGDNGAYLEGTEEEDERPLPSLFHGRGPPPFFDYDCDLVTTNRLAVADWNELYAYVNTTVKWNDTNFEFPEAYRHLVEGPTAQAAEAECPLGVLYLRVLEFYDSLLNKGDRNASGLQALADDKIQMLLRSFPSYAIALCRWPIFHALEHFAPSHLEPSTFYCNGQTGVLDWAMLRVTSLRWAAMKRNPAPEVGGVNVDDLEREIGDYFFTILRRPATQQQAQEECEFGFYFLVANQVVAAAGRETHHMPPFSRIMDTVLGNIPFIRLASCGWPIFAILVIYADLNKGIWFFGGDRKYLRGYSDWNLRRDELSPLVPSRLDFLSPAWREEAAETAEALAGLPALAFQRELRARVLRRERVDGEALRPIIRELADAALNIAAATAASAATVAGAGGTRRRLAYVVLLYGQKWSVILARMARRLRQLRVAHPLLVIAIGEEAAKACRVLASGGVGGGDAAGWPPKPHVVCWRPDTQSQVHRFTAIHAMLHLGVDILYMDMDTFLLRDPAPRVLAQVASGAGDGDSGVYEALFARHADADCVNIGVFYLRSTARTVIWMSQFLAWYHDHPFEIDQRGLHVFLGLPAKQMSIAWRPDDLVKVRAGILEDVNEIVIGDVGWHGTLPRMLIFHWCHRPIELKEAELNAAYDAGESLEAHNLPVSLAVEVVKAALPGTPWEKVLDFRSILQTYKLESPPERTACW